MPSLADTVQANKSVLTRDASGQLTEQTPEEVQSLAQKAGMVAPPTTPIGGAMIGANPNQQKMMGTPQQKQAALTLSSQPSQDLSTVTREQQARTQATAAEQGKIQKSQTLQNLGALGDRVNDFINTQKQGLDNQTASLQAASSGSTQAGTTQDLTSLQPVLAQLASDPTNMQLQLQVNQALGYDANRQLSPTEINQLYQSSTQSIAQTGAGAIQNTLTAQDLINQGGLGYDANQLGQLLGVPPDQVASMTVPQIQAQIDKIKQTEFSSSDQLNQQAGSGELGTAERGLAQQAGREASATGVRASEQDVANLNNQIASADTVSFNGQKMSVEDMLSDDNISKTITDYLNAGPDSPQRQQLDKSEPELSAFIAKNQAVLQDAADKLGAGATQFQGLQTSNKQAATLGGLIPDDLAAKLVPGAGQLSATALDPNSVPVLAAAQGLNDTQKQQYGQDLQQVAAVSNDATKELSNLTPAQIQALGMDSPQGKWNDYVNQMNTYKQVQQTSNPDQLLGMLFKQGNNEDFEHDAQTNASDYVLGVGKQSQTAELLDHEHDGNVDDPSILRGKVVSGQPSLSGILGGQNSVNPQKDYEKPQTPDTYNDSMASDVLANKPDAVQSALVASLGKFTQHGQLTGDNLNSVFGNPQSQKTTDVTSNLNELQYLADHGKLDSSTSAALGNLINQYKQVQNKTVSSAVNDSMKTLSPLLNTGRPEQELVPEVNKQIKQLTDLDDQSGGNPQIHQQLQNLETILRYVNAPQKMGAGSMYDQWTDIAKQFAKAK